MILTDDNQVAWCLHRHRAMFGACSFDEGGAESRYTGEPLRARSARASCPGGASDVERQAMAVLVSECNERTVNASENNP